MDEGKPFWKRILDAIISIPFKLWEGIRNISIKIAESLVPSELTLGPILQLITRWMIQLGFIAAIICALLALLH